MVAEPAIPPKPNAAATKAITKNTRAQYNMSVSPFKIEVVEHNVS
jgi:hypothetical protein